MKALFKTFIAVTFMICLMTSVIFIASPRADASGKLIAHYTFDDGFKDTSGNGNDGVVAGDVSIEDGGVMGKCADFKGGFLNVKSTPNLNLGKQFTISAWVMVNPGNSNGYNGAIISKPDDNAITGNYSAFVTDTSGARLDLQLKNGYTYVDDGNKDLGLSGSWSHLVFSSDGQILYLYQNGSLINTTVTNGGDDNFVRPSGKNVMIGNSPDRGLYKGKMDDLRIYDYALSSDEIKALYNEGTNPEVQTPTAATTGSTTPDTTVPGTTTPATGSQATSTTGNGGSPVTIINNTTNITNNTDTTNNANTNTNITGSTISNSNVASNNKVDQTTNVENAITVTQYVNVTINGQPLQSDVKPFINADGRTMLPLRAIGEALGADVQWDDATQTATLVQGDKTVKAPIGQNHILIKGKMVPMDTIAAIKDGRTLLPVRAIGEALGAKVGWDEQTKTVKLDK